VQKELHALADVEIVSVTILVDLRPLDVLHDEVRQAVVGGAAIEERRDIRVLQLGENLALSAESLQDEVGGHAAAHELDGHAALVVVVVALGKMDRAHSAASELADQAVMAHALTFAARLVVLIEGDDGGFDALFDEALACGAIAFEQREDFAANSLVARA